MVGDVIYIAKEKWNYGFQEYRGLDGKYRHYGIDVGDNRVIHFLNYDINGSFYSKIIQSIREEFSCGCKIKKCYKTSYLYNKNEIINRAFSMVNSNFGGYDIDNNCENFVRWCITGIKESDDSNYLINNTSIQSHNKKLNIQYRM